MPHILRDRCFVLFVANYKSISRNPFASCGSENVVSYSRGSQSTPTSSECPQLCSPKLLRAQYARLFSDPVQLTLSIHILPVPCPKKSPLRYSTLVLNDDEKCTVTTKHFEMGSGICLPVYMSGDHLSIFSAGMGV